MTKIILQLILVVTSVHQVCKFNSIIKFLLSYIIHGSLKVIKRSREDVILSNGGNLKIQKHLRRKGF
ncbi:hypothetical protein [Candidatus Tisiphia endosymbiont of Nedyus quadrimaculatus]|uniref:hypothetical protein n=1 Tax=Candidatus Tisiphia endosymbiont of Nedyus quadrimaculatus TaxID=3139332 RepID=UPI00345EFA54